MVTEPTLTGALAWMRFMMENILKPKNRERFRLVLTSYDVMARELAALRSVKLELEIAEATIRDHVLAHTHVQRIYRAATDDTRLHLDLDISHEYLLAARIDIAGELGLKVAKEIARAIQRHGGVPS